MQTMISVEQKWSIFVHVLKKQSQKYGIHDLKKYIYQ